MHACCSCDAGPNDARSQAGVAAGALLLDGRDVERGQQVHGVDAGVGELAQLRCPRLAVNARYVPRSASGTVSSVIEKSRTCSSQIARSTARSTTGAGSRSTAQGERRVVEVDDDGACRVHGERDRVGVGHRVRLDRTRGGRVDLDDPAVFAARLDRGIGHRPGTGCRDHRRGAPAGRRSRRRPRVERHRLRGRRPHRERGPLSVERGAECGGCRARRVQVVEHTGQLQAGGR